MKIVERIAEEFNDVRNTTYTKDDIDYMLASGTGGVPIVNNLDPKYTLSSEDYVLAADSHDNYSNKKLSVGSLLQYNDLSTDFYQGPYGVTWDNYGDTYARTGARGYTSIQSLMKKCVLNADGSVNYYLNAGNANLKEDGVTPSDLTGADGNVMVEIPKFYVKMSNTHKAKNVSISQTEESGYVLHPAFIKNGIEVSHRYYGAYQGYYDGTALRSISGVSPTRNQLLATFRTQAEANGPGWHLLDWNLLNAVRILYFIEYANWNSQATLGPGTTTGWQYDLASGECNSLGNGSSSSSSSVACYRGIEHIFGGVWKWVDGVNVKDKVFYVNSNPSTFANKVYTGDYVNTGITVATSTLNFINDVSFSTYGFIPTAVGGSSFTYITDGLWSASGVVDAGVAHGGSSSSSNDEYAGIMALAADMDTDTWIHDSLGATIAF